MENSSGQRQRTTKPSTVQASGDSTSSDATNWISVALRRSTALQKARWYSVPAVIAVSEMPTASRLPQETALTSTLCRTTSATPASPSATPSHCGGRSCWRSTWCANTAVSSGWVARISATMPAEMPRYCA